VTITGVDDKVADGPQPYVVHVTPKPESADPDYVKVLETDVSVVNIDDDSPGVTVIAASGLTTTRLAAASPSRWCSIHSRRRT
jgi:hypothetical protein